jgi:hypothetical protein
VKSFGDESPARPLGRPHAGSVDARTSTGLSAVVGNERMTALAGAVLLVLLVVELATSASLRTLLSVHIFVGVLLAGPLAVKLGSTGYRLLRYYTRSPAFVRRGPPHPALRVLAPLLVVTMLVVIGSGIGLVVTGPQYAVPFRQLHSVSVLLLLPLLAIHVFAHIRRVPRLVADDWSKPSGGQAPGRGRRLGMNLGALMLGALAAVLLLPVAAPWLAWSTTNGKDGPSGPLIAGMLLATLAVLAAAARPLKWK